MIKQKIIYGFFISLSVTGWLEAKASDLMTFNDMCPGLSKEISSLKPKYEGFVSSKSGGEAWSKEYDKYKQALEKFESKYNAELKKVKEDWAKIKEKQFPSEVRFNELMAIDDNELFYEVRAACWNKVMGADEHDKYNYCNPLEKPPASKEWNDILVCTMERVNLLKIEIYE
jgi:hypothetical protein